MYSRILVPVDGSEPANRALHEAIRLAHTLNAGIRLIHVIDAWVLLSTAMTPSNYGSIVEVLKRGGQELLQDAQAQVAAAGVEVDTVLVEAQEAGVGACIVHKAREYDADLIVCGTHGRRGMQRLLMGSDAEYVVRHANVPVLLVRSVPESSARSAAA